MAEEREETAEEIDEELEATSEIEVRAPGLGKLEEQEFKKRGAERDKISLVETILLFMVAAAADVFEIIADSTIVLWIFGLIVGSLASGIIFMGAILRGGTGYLFWRVIITIAGWFLDAVLLGIFPIRTLALLLTIWANNRDANRRIKEAAERTEQLLKSA